ncbi:hypothetical protein D3C81_1533730 [compost metagenome]
MKSPIDIPDPDPVVSQDASSLEDLLDVEPEDGTQQPHLSAARHEGLNEIGS